MSPYSRYSAVSPAADHDSIMQEFSHIYARDPGAKFKLLNMYKQLPFTSGADVVDIKNDTVEFATTPSQFHLITDAAEVVIKAGVLKDNVVGKLVQADHRRLQVTLGEFGYAELHADKRTSVRVRLKIPMHLQMSADGNKVSGVIDDISLSGVCIRTIAGSVVERAQSLELKFKLLHAVTSEVMEASIPSRLVRMDGKAMHAQCTVVFDHTPQTEQVISTFIYHRQLEIIKEIKSKI